MQAERCTLSSIGSISRPALRIVLASLVIVRVSQSTGAEVFAHPTESWIVSYPAGWDTNASDVTNGSSFRTCSSQCHVQIVPEGQAEIVVRTLPPSTDEFGEMDTIVRGNDEIPRTPNLKSSRRDYRCGDGKFHASVVAVRKGGRLFSVQLMQQLAPDQNGAEYEGFYQAVLSSIRVP
jgi:hypothetical protein